MELKREGFILVKLLVVIGIIALLARPLIRSCDSCDGLLWAG